MAKNKKQDEDTAELVKILQENYLSRHPEARIDVYRYNSASIRVRIIDPIFRTRNITRRDHEVWKILKKHASEDLLEQLSVVLLLAPEELTTSLMNREFDDLRPSRL